MIDAVKQQLHDMALLDCISPSLHGQEKGKSVNLSPRPHDDALKLKVDNGLIKDGSKKCDCLYFYQTNSQKRFVILVELKGNNYHHALEQFIATKEHKYFKHLLSVIKPTTKPIAVAIVSKACKTNRPAKDDWEKENGLRLYVLPVDENEGVELVKLLIKR